MFEDRPSDDDLQAFLEDHFPDVDWWDFEFTPATRALVMALWRQDRRLTMLENMLGIGHGDDDD